MDSESSSSVVKSTIEIPEKLFFSLARKDLGAAVLFAYLCNKAKAEKCRDVWANENHLREELNMGWRSIRRAYDILKARHLVEKYQATAPDGRFRDKVYIRLLKMKHLPAKHLFRYTRRHRSHHSGINGIHTPLAPQTDERKTGKEYERIKEREDKKGKKKKDNPLFQGGNGNGKEKGTEKTKTRITDYKESSRVELVDGMFLAILGPTAGGYN